MSNPTTSLAFSITNLPIRSLLENAARLANRSPRVDLPHILNAILLVCYECPGFVALPPAVQCQVLEWIGARVMVRSR